MEHPVSSKGECKQDFECKVILAAKLKRVGKKRKSEHLSICADNKSVVVAQRERSRLARCILKSRRLNSLIAAPLTAQAKPANSYSRVELLRPLFGHLAVSKLTVHVSG